MLGGKRFIPDWVLADGGEELFNTLVKETLDILGRDPNIAGDQVICFLMKASKDGSEKWESAIIKNPDALVALSKALTAQWFKKPEWQERIQILIDDPTYDTNLWHDLEKDIIDVFDKRAAKKGRKITNTNNLYETLYDDGTWKLFTPICFEGDVELASHMKPFKGDGKVLTKTQWCTAAQKMYFDNYTDKGTHKLYVIQKWNKGEYTEAWQLSFLKNRIEFMNKRDSPSYKVVRTAPEELLKKIVCDNKESVFYGALSLYDVFNTCDKVNDIYKDEYKEQFIRRAASIEGDFYVVHTENDTKIVEWTDTHDVNSTELLIPKGVRRIDRLDQIIWTREKDGVVRNIETVVVPEGVEVLGESCFNNFLKLKNIVLPSTLKEICTCAFRNCNELEELVIPEGVVKFTRCAIFNCPKLKRVELPSTLKEIPEGAISDCPNVETVDYPGEADLEAIVDNDSIFVKNLKTSKGVITERSYMGSEFETFEIPANTIIIEDSAFRGCPNLQRIVIPASVERIDEGVFCACESLQSIVFEPDCKVKSIPGSFAAGCPNLREVVLPEGLLEIGNNAFVNTAIESITIPASVKTLGDYCFEGCVNLQEVVFPTNSQLTTIKSGIFRKCSSLGQITLPKKLAKIGSYAFAWTALEEITIPRRVSVITSDCFKGCESLKRATITDNVSKIEDDAFADCTSFEKLKVLVLPDLLDDFDPYTDIEYAARSFIGSPYAAVLKKHGIELYD
mgnify:CR=1 FL=1